MTKALTGAQAIELAKDGTVTEEPFGPEPDDAGPDELMRDVQAVAEILSARSPVAEAELALHGMCPVTVVHGRNLCDQGSHMLYRVLRVIAQLSGRVPFVQTNGDHTTFLFAGETAGRAAETFQQAAGEVVPKTWRITQTAHPAAD